MSGETQNPKCAFNFSVSVYLFSKRKCCTFSGGFTTVGTVALFLGTLVSTLVLHCGSIARHSCSRFYCASSELVSYKGIVQHDREFQLPRYLGIGRLMIAVHRFNTLKANTI